MRRSSGTAPVSWAYRVCRDKHRRPILSLCASILLVSVLPAWAAPGRIVLANGKLHRITFGCGVAMYCSTGNLQYNRGVPNTYGVFASDGTKTQSTPYKVCKTWIPPIYAYPEPSPVGESLAVFNNQVVHAFTADTDCNDHSKGMSAYVARFDLRATPDFPNGQWIPELKQLGRVHTDNAGRGAGSGAAITVFDNTLYVFTDSDTYTSLDGTGWATHGAPLYANPNEQPLDAVTINPPNGQRILVVYGYMSGQHAYYDRLEAVDWNGQFDTASHAINHNGFFNTHVAGRVSLSAGTKAAGHGLAAGAKQAAVQLFAQTDTYTVRHMEYTYSATGGAWTTDPTTLAYLYSAGPSLTVYPWSVSQCDASYPKRQAQKQRIVVFSADTSGYSFDSDSLVPQNTDLIKDCATVPAGTGTATDDPTGDPLNIRKHYWSLLGVVLGPAPFGDNGLTDESIPDYTAIHDLSKVKYEQSAATKTETENETTNEVMFSIGSNMKAGLFDPLAISKNFDATYKHAWEKAYGTTSTEKMVVAQTVGTVAEGTNDLGHHGWAVFSAPIVRVQNWKVYAYDYNYQTGSGTPLDMSVQTISSLGGSAVMWMPFDLADPASTDPILAGMERFGYSRDLAFWSAPKNPDDPGDVWNWQQDERWETRFGNGTTGDTQVQVLQFGSVNEVSYELTNETMSSSGYTNQVEVKGGAGIEDDVALLGFPLELTAGYTGIFKWKTTNTTESGTSVSLDYTIPTCLEGPNCLDALLVQPYWLKAVDSTKPAPWVPTAYQSQQPWCLTWRVLRYHYKGTPTLAGHTGGTALPPQHAFGRIVSGAGGGQREDPYSHYVIQGGRLAWVDPQEAEQRIPMTADGFVPSQGVSIEINGMAWSSAGNGSWKRSGDTWTFDTDPRARRNQVTLRLDFGSATYDLQIQKADLDGRVPAGVANTDLVLVVNQRYTFHTALQQDIDIRWSGSQLPKDDVMMSVTSFEGRYNSATQSGRISLEGTLPAQLSAFGDVEVDINGDPYIAHLTNLDGFQQAFETGGVIRYVNQGAILTVDFGKKTWSASFSQEAFNRMPAPRWGNVRARILVGGVPWFTGDTAVVDYSANLKLRR